MFLAIWFRLTPIDLSSLYIEASTGDSLTGGNFPVNTFLRTQFAGLNPLACEYWTTFLCSSSVRRMLTWTILLFWSSTRGLPIRIILKTKCYCLYKRFRVAKTWLAPPDNSYQIAAFVSVWKWVSLFILSLFSVVNLNYWRTFLNDVYERSISFSLLSWFFSPAVSKVVADIKRWCKNL